MLSLLLRTYSNRKVAFNNALHQEQKPCQYIHSTKKSFTY